MLTRPLAALAVLHVLSAAALAGPITPPAGPVAPTMKTIHQAEPRTPLSAETTPGDIASVLRITQPGSYYLTGNMAGVAGKNGIVVAADNVTIDLAGFTLAGVAGSTTGITCEGGRRGITVVNGCVTAWGGLGIDFGNSAGNRANRVERVHAAFNGSSGIRIGGAGVVERCTAHANGLNGIDVSGGSVLAVECSSSGNTGVGYHAADGARLVACTAHGNISSGFQLLGATAESCEANLNQQDGIRLLTGSAAIRCAARQNAGDGLEAADNSLILECRATGHATTGAAGVRLTGSGTRLEATLATGNAYGIYTISGGNFIARNTAHGNPNGNYNLIGTQTVGPIITATGTITTTNPWANFEF